MLIDLILIALLVLTSEIAVKWGLCQSWLSFIAFNCLTVRMAHNALLVLTRLSQASVIFRELQGKVKNTLYVHIPPAYNKINGSKTVFRIYSAAGFLDRTIDVRILLTSIKDPQVTRIHTKNKIETVFLDRKYSTEETRYYAHSLFSNAEPRCCAIDLSSLFEENDSVCASEADLECHDHLETYENVVLGGTFDRLHCGHKILLSEAVLRCSKQVTVGVTDTPMLKGKKLWELIEPCADRMRCVEDFLNDVYPNLSYNIVPITDAYGPTKTDPNFQLLVVSSETVEGGKKINEARSKAGLPLLKICALEVLPNCSLQKRMEEENKISSSNFRQRLLGNRMCSATQVNTILPKLPYIIGLTGGITSGKSTLCNVFREAGAGIIDCDILAHKLYRRGEECYDLIIQNFGEDILDSEKEVDRKKLGNAVFQNKEKLLLLNNIVWPCLLKRMKDEILRLYNEHHKIIVVEAAMLFPAGLAPYCHEVWVSIVSPELAVQRLMSRNNLSATEAMARIDAQLSNSELVHRAQVVFSTEGNEFFTVYQAKRAWKDLCKDLLQKNILSSEDSVTY